MGFFNGFSLDSQKEKKSILDSYGLIIGCFFSIESGTVYFSPNSI